MENLYWQYLTLQGLKIKWLVRRLNGEVTADEYGTVSHYVDDISTRLAQIQRDIEKGLEEFSE